jgi:opacity protein-like surface antigen
MTLRIRFLATVAICLGVWVGGNAQEVVSTCEETLGRAEDEFNAGRFYGIPVVLSDCLSKFSRDQRFRAYLLLTQAYLLIDDQKKAEESFIEVLRADPEFVPNEQTESVDIVNLSKKFTSTAIFTPHAKAGMTLAIPRIVRPSDLYGMDVEGANILKPGWNVGAGLEWNLTNNWGIGAELFFAYKAYRQTRSGFFDQDFSDRRSQQSWIDVPIYARYTDNKGKWRPFGYAGYAFNLLVSSRSLYRNTDFTASGGGDGAAPFQVPNESPALNSLYKNKMLTRSFLVGGGVKYKIGRDFLLVEARYMAGTNILNKQSVHLAAEGDGFVLDQQIPGFAYLSDFFRLDNFVFNVGFVRPLYQPRKIKRGGILSFLRKGARNE